MGFPSTPDDGDVYTTANGVSYVYESATNKWKIRTQDLFETTPTNGAVTKGPNSDWAYKIESEAYTKAGVLTLSSMPVISQLISDNSLVTIDSADVADDEYARFTANGLESRSVAEVKSDLSLNNVTNESKATMFTSPTFTGTVTFPANLTIAGQATTIAIKDNEASALDITESTNSYIKIVTTNDAEKTHINNPSINLGTPLATDGTYNGITIQMTAGETLAFGDGVYITTTGYVKKADADAISTMPVIGAVVVGGSDGAAVTILTHGQICETSWAWTTTGALLYMDTTTAGLLTETAPSGSGDVIQVIGIILSPDTVLINPCLMYQIVV